MSKGKAIIFSAPSGAGKTTIVHHLLRHNDNLAFSISACTRSIRPEKETNGVDYYFLSNETFRKKITHNEFVEWEEVYDGVYYGTLRSEVERLWAQGKNVIFDVDVQGGVNLKNFFGDRALAVFVKVPDLMTLRSRLENRNTESSTTLENRLKKAAEEITYEQYFDVTLVNETLEDTLKEAQELYSSFLQKQ
jgi:guanylate kinase